LLKATRSRRGTVPQFDRGSARPRNILFGRLSEYVPQGLDKFVLWPVAGPTRGQACRNGGRVRIEFALAREYVDRGARPRFGANRNRADKILTIAEKAPRPQDRYPDRESSQRARQSRRTFAHGNSCSMATNPQPPAAVRPPRLAGQKKKGLISRSGSPNIMVPGVCSRKDAL